MIDAFFAATILFLGIGFVLSDYISVPEQRQAQLVTEDLGTLLLLTKLADIDDPYVLANTAIIDETLTPAEQAHIWTYNSTYEGCMWCGTEAEALIESLTQDIVPDQLGVSVAIDGTYAYPLFERTVSVQPALMLVSQEVLLSLYNDTLVIGPDILEVRVWQ